MEAVNTASRSLDSFVHEVNQGMLEGRSAELVSKYQQISGLAKIVSAVSAFAAVAFAAL